MTIKIKKIDDTVKTPIQGTELAGGWDVFCHEIEVVDEAHVICKLGFALQPPSNYKVMMAPRSSLTKTKWLVQNLPMIGDADFRGYYQIRFRCLPEMNERYSYGEQPFKYEPFPFKVGERIAQMWVEEVIPIFFERTDELNETVRGEGGWGSSGRH
jgi:dUTP pyrophosphatase